MKVSKAQILILVFLIASLAGAWAVYNYYVKEELKDLSDHQTKENQLEDKIKQLEEKFYGTKPGVVLTEYAQKAQPWEDAVLRRSKFFNMGDTLTVVKVPEEAIPKFYYQEVFPKMRDELTQEAWSKGVQFPINFGVPDETLSNMEPSRQDVTEWLTQVQTYSDIARVLIDANAQQIEDISMWPPRRGPGGISGWVQYRTYGLQFTMSMQNFAGFLEDLALDKSRFYTVDHLWIHNKSLRNSNAPMQIQMLLTQARYIPTDESGPAGGPGGAPQIDANNAFAGGGTGDFGLFGGASPFGVAGNAQEPPKISFTRRILNLFPF